METTSHNCHINTFKYTATKGFWSGADQDFHKYISALHFEFKGKTIIA